MADVTGEGSSGMLGGPASPGDVRAVVELLRERVAETAQGDADPRRRAAEGVRRARRAVSPRGMYAVLSRLERRRAPAQPALDTDDDLAAATLQRMLAAADALLPPDRAQACRAAGGMDRQEGRPGSVSPAAPATVTQLAIVGSALFDACPPRPGPAHWLTLTAAYGAFPDAAAVESLARRLELEHRTEILADVLGPALGLYRRPLDESEPARSGAPVPAGRRLVVVSDRPVVDVDFCARHDTHTGIQRVVRETLPLWALDHAFQPVAHTDRPTGYRQLTARERHRVLDFDGDWQAPVAEDRPALVVPWRTVVVMPDVLNSDSVDALASLAQYSGNEVALVGYDMIPLVSAELRPLDEATVFAHYLRLVKHADRVAAISSSAATEFAGFAAMLPAQGLPGPRVHEVRLAEDVGMTVPPAEPEAAPPSRPVVLALGRREPHKNIGAVLHAAERLWAEGLDFEVVLLGGPGWDERVLRRTITRLRESGRALTELGWVSDEEMVARLRDASFSVFVSLHEGYGLPVSESLACGTPVVTTAYGSQAEIAAGGGCLVVDPRDDRALAGAMRRLITQPALLASLRAEVATRPARGWPAYAADAWSFLVDGVAPVEDSAPVEDPTAPATRAPTAHGAETHHA